MSFSINTAPEAPKTGRQWFGRYILRILIWYDITTAHNRHSARWATNVVKPGNARAEANMW